MADEHAPDELAADEGHPRPALGRITRVILKNYKSIVSCDVELQPLTILVGPNGSGKSNFLDALSFVKQALTVGLEQAIRNRGNVERILSKARASGDDSFSIELHFQLPSRQQGRYGFAVEQLGNSEYGKRDEALTLSPNVPLASPGLFAEVDDSDPTVVTVNGVSRSRRQSDDFFLARHSDDVRMRPAYDLLTNMTFYTPLPDTMRLPVEHDSSSRLLADGRNVASILRRIQESDPDHLFGVSAYLRRILPGLEAVKVASFQTYDHLTFSMRRGDEPSTADFAASQMSDGTLRALAVLVALFQGRLGGKAVPSLVGIEEPENNIHPAAARILLAAMKSAAYDSQVLVTTHSADMLHMGDVDMSSVLVVSAEDGVTKIGPVDAVSQSIVRDNIFTVGELLQMDQLRPEIPTDTANGDTATHQPVVGRS